MRPAAHYRPGLHLQNGSEAPGATQTFWRHTTPGLARSVLHRDLSAFCGGGQVVPSRFRADMDSGAEHRAGHRLVATR